MKYLAIIFAIFAMVGILVFSGSGSEVTATNDYLRIHIRANSNSEQDQNIKYEIKNAVVDYLIPLLASCESKKDAQIIIKQNLTNLEAVANNILSANHFNYTSNAKLNYEIFPARNYGNLTLESGFYDALIMELGTAQGDNWWCIVYPPLCFVNGSTSVSAYKSRILELINSFFN